MSKIRKTYTYGGGSKKKDDKDGWKEISAAESSTSSEKINIPKSKGIWSNVISVSPFKKSPMKLAVNTAVNDDPFGFDDDDNDCFSFKENGIKASPKKVKRTPSKQMNSPQSPTGVNPRLFGKALPDTCKTINVSDLTPEKNTKASKAKGKQLKKGTLAALKAELNSPKKSPTKSPKKGSLAELREKLTSPKKTTKDNAKLKSSAKGSKKGSLADLKAKLSSPKNIGNVKNDKKSPGKKISPKVVSKKVKKSPTIKPSSKKETVSKSLVNTTNRKRKVEDSKDVSPVKRKVGRPAKIEETNKKSVPTKTKANPSVKSTSSQKLHSSSLRLTGRTTRSVASISPPKRTTSRSRRNDGNLLMTEIIPKKRKPRSKYIETEENELPEKRKNADASEIEFVEPFEVNDEENSPKNERDEEENSQNEYESEEVQMEVENVEAADKISPTDSLAQTASGDESICDIVQRNGDDEIEENIGDGANDAANGSVEAGEEEVSDEGEPEIIHKTKSVFSYYDKQKKGSNENIYGDSKKNVLIFDDDDDGDGAENDEAVIKETRKKEDSTAMQQVDKDIGRPDTPTPGQDEAAQQEDREKKLVKSPFKSLKPQYRKYRRFSALPTDITMIGNTTQEQGVEDGLEENEDDEKSSFHMSNIFGQSGSSSLKVKRDEKELYTVVRDTKNAYQCLEHGESQMFKDDLEYLIDGMKSTHNSVTRCLSALELASKCMSPEFRMHMKAHGMIDSIFSVLQDAHTDELLCLCTLVIMYIVSKDRQKTGFSKKIIAFVLNLLTNTPTKQNTQKSSEKINSKVKSLFEKYNDSTIDCGNISSAMLARETLLSLTSQKTGDFFKDDIRTLGGLDHIADSVYASSRCIQKREDLEKNYRQTERCLLLLCDVTFKCPTNQEYLVTYRDGTLIEALVRILTFITTKVDLTNDFNVTMQNCMFTMLRFLTNLSHENELGSVKICKQEDALQCFLRCVLYMPQFLPDKKTFDFIVVALGLLINLTEHSKQNIAILNTAFGPACYESENSSSIDDEVSPVEALTHLFMVRNAASKEGDLMEELERLEKEQDEKEAAMHYHDGEDALVCGDKFDDTVEEESETTHDDSKKEESDEKGNTIELNQKEKQDIKNTLEKAHQHMEDSHVAAYSALLIGLLAEGNKDNQDTIHSLLPDGDFQPMKESLEKILAFMKMTGATNDAGFKVIQRVIDFFKHCTQSYQKTSSS